MSNIKKELLDTAPKPDWHRKDVFIRLYRKQHCSTQISTLHIIKSQFGFIHMPVWIISLSALIVAIWGISMNRDIICAVSVIMPFVSGVAVFESFRSRMYGMTEMEGVTVVSMRGIFFARIICVGISHVLLLFLLTVLVGCHSRYGFLMSGEILTIPYLLSSVGSMELERTVVGRNNAFCCITVSATVSFVMLAFQQNERVFFDENYRWIWFLACLILIIMECVELRKRYFWEEYAWN